MGEINNEVLKRINEAKEKKSVMLDLGNCDLDEIPVEILELTHLESLYIGSNQITEIKNLDTLVNLTRLDLSYNNIEEIENLDTLTSLTHLFLDANKIREIKNLNSLTSLEVLYLDENYIEKLVNIEALVNLEELQIAENKIKNIGNIDSLVSLIELHLGRNNIKDITALLSLIKSGIAVKYDNYHPEEKSMAYTINLSDNPIIIPPISIVKEGNEAVLKYFDLKDFHR